MNKNIETKGFTLIELMLVVAIIGLLAAIALPKFANLVIKAKEASVRGKLGSLRSAFSIYYADNDGYPGTLGINVFDIALLWTPKYIHEIPSISIPTLDESVHGRGAANFYGATQTDATWSGAQPFPWYVQTKAANLLTGIITVNCSHTDSKGTTWSLW